MELTELHDIWVQYDQKLSWSIRLNKEILKRMLISKTEKKLTRIRIESGVRIIIPLILFPTMLLYKTQFRSTLDFYIGLCLFVFLFILVSAYRIKHFMLAGKIDFSNHVTSIRIALNKLMKYQLKMSRVAVLLVPLGLISVFLLLKIPFLDRGTLLPLILIAFIFTAKIILRNNYSYQERFRKLDMEIKELEELEKD